MRRDSLFLWLLLLAASCTEKQPLEQVDPEERKKILLKAAPKPQHALDIQLGDKVRLLGYDLESPVVREGEAFTVVWYWQVLAPLEAGYKVFTHVADTKESRINLDAKRPFRRAYPESEWKKGDFLRDEQKVTLPKSWNEPTATFYVGFWKDQHRLPITKGPHDNENRARALTLTVSGGKGGESLPRLIARRITAPIVMDGHLDEADWEAAERSGPFVQTMTGAPGSFQANVRVLYDSERLVLGYEVSDDFLKSTFKERDDHLWEQDTIEVMLDPDGDGENYFEVQVAPTAQVFDTRYDSRRQPRPFGDVAWSSAADAKVELRGELNDDDEDEGYTVEVALPFSAFAAGEKPAAPPAKGATWRMAFFVMDARKQGQRAVGWSPPMVGDFHTLERFGRVVFPHAASDSIERARASSEGPAAPPASTSTDAPKSKTKAP